MTDDRLKQGPRQTQTKLEDIKIALFDIDNTLVGNETPNLPTKRFKRAADDIKGKVTLAIASARYLPKAIHIINYISASGYSILGNGTQIYDGAKKEIVADWTIDSKTTKQIVGFLSESNIKHWVNDGGYDYFPVNEGKVTVYKKQKDMWDMDGELDLNSESNFEKPYVCVARMITEDEVKWIRKFIQSLSEDNVTTLIAHEREQSNGSYLFDMLILNRNANKRNAFVEALELQSIDSENAMVVGDGRNDEVIVAAAGIGVAMGNAAEQTLNVATHIAPNQWDDGAAVVLEQVIEAKQIAKPFY